MGKFDARAPVLLAGQLLLAAAVSAEQVIETVNVYGDKSDSGYSLTEDSTATRLGLSVLETPQSVSAITQSQLRDFALVSVNQALATSSAVQVQSVETDRTYYTARGFDITNFQLDGVGMPLNYGNSSGEVDTAMYQRIEVVRGANGLMSGAGNPSATVNMIRKRPGDEPGGAVTLTGGSWSKRRLEADANLPLNESSRARVVVARESRDSYLDLYSLGKSLGYAVVEHDLDASTRLTVGASFQSSDADSPLWGALPLFYSDGSQTDYDVSTTTAAEWAYWDTNRRAVFAEWSQQLDNGWQFIASFTRESSVGDSELFYMYSQPDRNTEVGLLGYASAYEIEDSRTVFDLYLTGDYSLWGREHELVLGYNAANATVEDQSLFDFTTGAGFPAIGDFRQWRGVTPRPVFADGKTGSDWEDRQRAVYAATRLKMTESLSLTTGARTVNWNSNGTSYGESQDTRATGRVLPYAGLVYRFADDYVLYTSYTETFMPQRDIDANFRRLDPAEGRNTEVGIKGEFFDGRLLSALSVYRASHDNVSEFAGTSVGPNGVVSIYRGADYGSEGVELDISGYLAEGLQGNINFTALRIEDGEGEGARHYVPKRIVNASLSYQLPSAALPLRVGGSLRWQDDIYRETPLATRVEQDAYTLISLFAQYAITDQVTAAVNLNNVTDEKYINSLYWQQGYYGAPRHGEVSVTWRY